MDTREYVDKLFEGYESTQELRDFKMEIAANLDDRVTDLIKNGSTGEEAFSKAVSELGNITEIADEISRQKRNEVINRMYVHQGVKITTGHAVGYVLAGCLFLFGVVVGIMAHASVAGGSGMLAAMPFVTTAAAIFVYLGLRQETSVNFPMGKKRALWYALASGLGTFGIMVTAGTFMHGEYYDFYRLSTLGILVPFALPAAGWLTFLLLTEKKRHKPWVTEQIERYMNEYAENFSGKNAERFGIQSGMLWVLSIALFITLGICFGFQYAWLVFLFSIVGEMWLVYSMMYNK